MPLSVNCLCLSFRACLQPTITVSSYHAQPYCTPACNSFPSSCLEGRCRVPVPGRQGVMLYRSALRTAAAPIAHGCQAAPGPDAGSDGAE